MSVPTGLLIWLQIVVSILTLAGVAFTIGRLVGRIDTMERVMNEVRDSLFGVNGGEGAFLRKSEARLMFETVNREHASFDDRLTDLAGKMPHDRRRRGRDS